jgi:hypothetical protein
LLPNAQNITVISYNNVSTEWDQVFKIHTGVHADKHIDMLWMITSILILDLLQVSLSLSYSIDPLSKRRSEKERQLRKISVQN